MPECLRLPFDLEVDLPGSKSHANRALIAACLAEGHSELVNATPCDDVVAMVQGLSAMGFSAEWKDRERGLIVITGGLPSPSSKVVEIDCGHAGTTLRFLTAVAAVVPGEWVLTGSSRMRERPIAPLVNALRSLGAEIEASTGCPPVRVRGGSLSGGVVRVDASVSSQFASALELISPVLDEPIELDYEGSLASSGYVELAKHVKSDFGVESPGDRYLPNGRYEIEGDWSAVGSFLVLAEITHSRMTGRNLSSFSRQADRALPEHIAALRGKGYREVDVTLVPDQLMNLAVLAAHRSGETRFVGAANLRQKECDRLAVITSQLKKVGVDICEEEDGVVIRGPAVLRPATLNPHDDHRMAMAFAILSSTSPGIVVGDADCVSKSYPRFFEDLKRLHVSPRCVAIVGMRGAGKTVLGRALAKELGWDLVDTDAVIESQVGSIADYVSEHGWEQFRFLEEKIVLANLSPRRVVALGGGAVESADLRKALAVAATVVFVDASVETLRARVAGSARPSLTGQRPEDELEAILLSRMTYYKAVADITCSGTGDLADAVADISGGLQRRCSW